MLRPPDIVSLLNLACGIASIAAAHSGSFDLALIFLLLAAIADGADGYIARRFRGGELGEQLDSLADAVSFGVAPALFVYMQFVSEDPLIAIIPGVYAICGVLRLARFNSVPSNKTGFEGLPITAACTVLVTYLLLGESFVRIDFVLALSLALSVLMVSSVTYPKIRNIKLLGFVASVFGITILLYFIDEIYNLKYLNTFSILPFILMLIYISSPFFKIRLLNGAGIQESSNKLLKTGGRKER
jgi:CDP-diacylglycerol--serine O-phosphatidyltransferase